MAKPNYAFAKRQRDLAKKAKKEEKRLRKAQGGSGGAGGDEQEGQPEEPQAVPGANEVEGAGAHSKLSLPQRIFRQMRYKQPREYMERALRGEAVQEQHDVAVADLPFEFMMNALRLVQGFPARLFDERTGLPLAVALQQLERAEALGLIQRDHERIAPTLRGQRFLNELLQLFLPFRE